MEGRLLYSYMHSACAMLPSSRCFPIPSCPMVMYERIGERLPTHSYFPNPLLDICIHVRRNGSLIVPPSYKSLPQVHCFSTLFCTFPLCAYVVGVQQSRRS